MNKNKGFTLIEIIIYIALFSILIGSAFITVYQLIENSGKLNTKTNIAEEGNFVLRKINWVMTGVSSIASPSTGTPTSNTLTITKYSGNTVSIRLNVNKIEIKESTNGNIFIPLTTSNVKVSSLNFQYIPTLGDAPAGITANITMNGKNFTITKYIRK